MSEPIEITADGIMRILAAITFVDDPLSDQPVPQWAMDCDCPLDPHHRWNCTLTPIWAQVSTRPRLQPVDGRRNGDADLPLIRLRLTAGASRRPRPRLITRADRPTEREEPQGGAMTIGNRLDSALPVTDAEFIDTPIWHALAYHSTVCPNCLCADCGCCLGCGQVDADIFGSHGYWCAL